MRDLHNQYIDTPFDDTVEVFDAVVEREFDNFVRDLGATLEDEVNDFVDSYIEDELHLTMSDREEQFLDKLEVRMEVIEKVFNVLKITVEVE